MDTELYQEQLLEEAKNPAHKGKLAICTHQAKYGNASCGDMFEVYLEVENGKIIKVGWEGAGCSVSTASMSILSKEVVGKTASEVKQIEYRTICDLLGIDQISPARIKCVQTPIKAVQQAIDTLQ